MNRHSSENSRPRRTHLDSAKPLSRRLSNRPSTRSAHKFTQLSSRATEYPPNTLPRVSLKPASASPEISPEEQALNAKIRQQALTEAQNDNHAEAIALFTELISRDPRNASHYNNRGLVYFQMSELDKAIADYNQAIRLNPNLDSVYNNRANYYACQGQLLSAILDYDIAIDLNPSNVRAWINQGITFRELHMFERAIECLDTALNFRRLEGNIFAERGRTYHLWGDWNVAIALLPFSADALASASGRLRLQVELWFDDLLSPLTPNLGL